MSINKIKIEESIYYDTISKMTDEKVIKELQSIKNNEFIYPSEKKERILAIEKVIKKRGLAYKIERDISKPGYYIYELIEKPENQIKKTRINFSEKVKKLFSV